MNPDRWRQMVELAEEAAELRKAERAMFLDAACAGDEGLRKEVEALLAADEEAEGFIEAPAFGRAPGLRADHRSTKSGIRRSWSSGGPSTATHTFNRPAKNPIDEKMNRLTLRFSGDLENEFRRDHSQKSLKLHRAILLIGIFLYAIFGLLDRLLFPEAKDILWMIRYAIVCPIMACAYLLSFLKYFMWRMQLVLTVVFVLAGFGIIAMTAIAKPPNNNLYYAGLMLVLMFCSFARLRVSHAATGILLTIIAYEVTAIVISRSPGPILANYNFFLLAGALVSMSATYSMEFYMRRNFLQKRIIEARTRELEEKNEELSAKNRELVQSREELMRSAKRTELIFAALSDALPGTVLDDKYRLEEKVGSGGFGTVYRATHILLQSSVAVKVFRPSMGANALKDLERFRLEGISTCRIHHTNAVSVIDFGVSASSIAYLVMELLEGNSLRDELDKNGTLSVSRAIKILWPVCSVLAEAHSAGIIHRDIKPSNVFLHRAKAGELVKVVDFGIAKLMSDTLNPGMQSLTETGSVIGTPLYMAPERLTNRPYDGQADVYSLGVMAYEMLCGRLPFQSSKENYWTIVLMHVNDIPLMPRKINPEIPEKLEDLIMAVLAKSPEQRPTASELEQHLAEFSTIGNELITSTITQIPVTTQTDSST